MRNEALEEALSDEEMEVRTARKLRKLQRAAIVLGTMLGATVAAVTPFLKGHSFHGSWDSMGKYLVMLAMVLLPAFMLTAALTYGLWNYLRNMRKIHRRYAPPLSKERTGSR
jgi:ABC-type Co2+ transport system permease subunit